MADALERGAARGGIAAIDRRRGGSGTRGCDRLRPLRFAIWRPGQRARHFLHHGLRQARLHQHTFDSRADRATLERGRRIAGDHHDPNSGRTRIVLEAPRERDAVDIGHRIVGEKNVGHDLER